MPRLQRWILSSPGRYPLTTDLWPLTPALMQLHILVVHGIVVDAAIGRRNPCGHLAGLLYSVHEAEDVRSIALARQPLADLSVELFRAYRPSGQIGGNAGPRSDIAPETRAGQRQSERIAGLLDQPVPALHAQLAVADVGASRDFVHGIAHRDLLGLRASAPVRQLQRKALLDSNVILVLRLVRPALQSVREIGSRIRGSLRAEQVERRTEPEVQILLHRGQIDCAGVADRQRIFGA